MPSISREYHAHAGNYTPGGNSMRYIVVHYTGAPGSALNTAKWSQNDRHDSSFHYVLDGSGVIYQILDDFDTAWAVGAWRGATQIIRNSESISIEVCSDGEDFSKAEIEELRWLTLKLMREHGIPASNVVRHYDCHTGHKECPAPYVDQAKWNNLKSYITTEVKPEPMGYSTKLWPSNNAIMQQFKIEQASGGWVRIKSLGRNMYLDVKDGSKADHTPVRVWKGPTEAQLWKLIPVQKSYALLYELEPKLAPGMRLDAKGGGTVEKTGLQIHPDNNTAAQRWQFIDSGDGIYRIASSKSGLCIDCGPAVQ